VIVPEVHPQKPFRSTIGEAPAELRLPLPLRRSRMAAQAAAGDVAEPGRLCLGTRHVVHAQSISVPAWVPAVAQDTTLRPSGLDRRIQLGVLRGQRPGGEQTQNHERDPLCGHRQNLRDARTMIRF
jgi:hypothetical protein